MCNFKVILAFAVLCVALAAAVAVQPTEEFQQYMDQHGKVYTQEELPLRMAAYYVKDLFISDDAALQRTN